MRTSKDEAVESSFLDLLSKDIEASPHRLVQLDEEFFKRLNDLVGDVDVDLDQPLDGED